MSRGPNVFAVARSIWTDEDFADEQFSQREAWIWLIGAAAWKDCRVRGNAERGVDLKRGEFSFATRFLADKWLWSKSRVDRFIQMIEKRGIIRDTSRDGSKVYSIKNYNRFQVVGLPKRDSERDADWDDSGTAAGQQRDKEETGKQESRKTEEERATAKAAAAPSTPAEVVSRETLQGDLLDIPDFLDRRKPQATSRPEREQPSAEIVPFVQPRSEVERAFDAYNVAALAAGFREARRLDDRRAKALKARLAECGGFDGWATGDESAMGRIVSSKFLRGNNDRGWKPTGLDWFLKPANFTKLMEGAYDDTPGSKTAGGGTLERIARAASAASAAGYHGD